jgi:hypothetical protein
MAGEKFTPGMIGVTIVTKDPHLARSLWDRGWPVTAQSGRGESGPVTTVVTRLACTGTCSASPRTRSARPGICGRRIRPPNPARRALARAGQAMRARFRYGS